MPLLPPQPTPDEPGSGWRAALLPLVLVGSLALVVGLVKAPAALWIGVPALIGAVVVFALATRSARAAGERASRDVE